MLNPLNLCRVCGFHFEDGYLPWGEDGNSATFDFCPCCGVEFGYQDCQESAVLKFRVEWIDKGCLWSEPRQKPVGWRWAEQRENLAFLEGLPQLRGEEVNRKSQPIALEEMRELLGSYAPKMVKP